MKNSTLQVALIAVCALFFGTCAHHYDIRMEPARPEVKKIQGSPSIRFAGISDTRESKNELGPVRGGFGNVLGHVTTAESAKQVFDGELSKLLASTGYTVTAGGEGAVLSGELTELSSKGSGATAEARVVLTLELKRAGKKLLSRKLEGYQLRTTLWAITAKSFETVVDESLDQVMQKAADLVASKEFLSLAKGE